MKKDKKIFLKELKAGLSKKNKMIPSKFHYDLLGSKYFEKITQQKEYYPTRKEKEILKKLSKKISSLFNGNLSFVEIGSGATDKIKILLNTDFFKVKNKIKFQHFMIYTGEPDRYFNFKYGKLDWRSLIFKFQNFKKKYVQKCVQYNYPNNFKFTRSVEIKHVTKQKSNYTVISKEYPTSKGDPYYPISNERNINLFNKYKKLILKENKKNIFFEGRLANYKYFNTDEVIESALSLFKKLKKNYR